MSSPVFRVSGLRIKSRQSHLVRYIGQPSPKRFWNYQ